LNLHQKLSLPDLQNWIENVAKLTQPNKIYLCDGSEAEYQNLINEMQETEDLIKLNSDKYPNCYLHRSDPSDVARVEHLTYICSNNKDDAGPNNNWMDPKEAHSKMDLLFKNSMKNRTMYIIPYCMGPIDSPYSRCGIEITDSPYVVINMKLMTRMGQSALNRILKKKGIR
jgi:phosphoenolpyruvate carboxykinase (GTP)